MHEIFESLPADAWVLDAGCGAGSFAATTYPFRTVQADLSPRGEGARRVASDAAHLPFASRRFDAVILNNSLEHFRDLRPTLQEIGRVIKRDGAVFAAVPDATTFADRLYRKVYRNRGGHVNLFGSHRDLAAMLSWYFGLPHVSTKVLLSSFSFLHPANTVLAKGQMRIPPVPEWVLAAATGAVRRADHRFGTRLGVYGWAMYFGNVRVPETAVWENVCVRCGTGYPCEDLAGRIRRTLRLRWYRCPQCGAVNLYSNDAPAPCEG